MDWLPPWYSVADDTDQIAGLEKELADELAAGHPLFGLPVRTLARRQDCDDVLFAIEDGSGRVAVAHLTWARHPEPPPWPYTAVYPSLAAWAAEGMLADAEEFRE
ncbi:MAG: hypothetical protein K1X57_15380 [Gemmataceae bacterium]|nr:hypothetical protein [Gemmataceae bacterium]